MLGQTDTVSLSGSCTSSAESNALRSVDAVACWGPLLVAGAILRLFSCDIRLKQHSRLV